MVQLRPWRIAGALVAAAVCAAVPGAVARPEAGEQTAKTRDDPAIHAVFASRSYAAGSVARLRIWNPSGLTVQMFRAGRRSLRDDTLRGDAVSRVVRHRRPTRTVLVRIGEWPSGLYYARLRAVDGRLGFAPVIVRPRRLGTSRVAVVLPTNTWQAYNFRDVDRNGIGDTWYASPAIHVVRLDRPFLDRGVPPHSAPTTRRSPRWLLRRGHAVDMLADDDLDRVASGDVLARRYDLVIFAGHEEYVTAHTYDVVERYRDLGGNLAFLSANNFFYRVERRWSCALGRGGGATSAARGALSSAFSTSTGTRSGSPAGRTR